MIELTFKKIGKYKSDNKVIVIREEDLGKVFLVSGKNADNYVKSGLAEYKNAVKPKTRSRTKEEK